MKIIEHILKRHLPNSSCPNNIFTLTNNYITEVKSLVPISKNTNLVVGQIITYEKINGSQKLNLVTVDIGKKIVKIVCGASNLMKKKKVIVASEGSFLEGFNDTLKNKKIYGVWSQGMLCSLEELGIDSKFLTLQEQEGIYFFPDDNNGILVGSNALIPLGLEGFLLEIGITPNRADLLSHVGFAKDLQAVLPNDNIRDNNSKVKKNLPLSPLKVSFESEACYQYNACIFENIIIKPSPLWLRNTLSKVGVNPINNVVDITNLILIEYGIPLHAFDAKKVQEIKVRQAFNKETVTTLNQNICILNKDDLVITDGNQAIALAGIIGLFESKIHPFTNKIILEAAYFKPDIIAQTSQRLKIKTESSLRFERGIDPTLISLAFQRACELLVTLAGGKMKFQPVICQKNSLKAPIINLSLDFVKRKTGISFDMKQIQKWLLKLDYQVIEETPTTLKLSPPLRRYDIFIPENIISDLIRLYGCNKISLPTTTIFPNQMTLKQKNLRELKKLLVNLGFYETVTYSLVSQEMFETFVHKKDYIRILNPLSQDKIILRQSLLSSLLEVLNYQHKRQSFDHAFFEIAKVYYPQQEFLSLALALSGNFFNTGWLKNDVVSSFFVLKGLITKISSLLDINFTYEKTFCHRNLHPGMQANLLLDNKIIGIIGKTHPQLNDKLHLKDSFLCEIFLSSAILEKKLAFNYQEIAKSPIIIRDLSFLIDKKYSFQQVINTINKNSSLDLINYELFDVYPSNDDPLQHSLALRLFFVNPHKNLDKLTIDQKVQIIVNHLIQDYHIILR